MSKLRRYQEEAVQAVRESLRNPSSRPLLVLPTGSGKSHILAEVANLAFKKGNKTLILAHRKELISQNTEKIEGLGLEVGIYCASLKRKETDKQITVGTITSVINNLDAFNPQIIIVDEAHRISSKDEGQYRRLLKHFKDARAIGLTATPFRLSGQRNNSIVGEDKFFSEIAYQASIQDLIKQGFLSPLVTFTEGEKQAELKGLKKIAGDYQLEEAYQAMDKVQQHITNDIEKSLDGSRESAIVFCCNVAHAESINADLVKRGIASRCITGNTDQEYRDASIQAMRDKKVSVLCGCDIFIEGFDVPHIDLVVLARPTKSMSRYVQMVGRGLRISEGKEDCCCLDYGNNIEEHGPLNLLQLDTSGGSPKYNLPDYKVCKECGCVNKLTASTCVECQTAFQRREPTDPTLNLSSSYSKRSLIEKNPIYKARVVYLEAYKRKSKNGDNMLVFEYDVSRGFANETITEFILLEHSGFAKKNAQSLMKKRFGVTFSDVDSAIAHIKYVKNNVRLSLATFDHSKGNPKYPKVTWKETLFDWSSPKADTQYATVIVSEGQGDLGKFFFR